MGSDPQESLMWQLVRATDEGIAEYLRDQMEWSRRTFGEAKRTLRICDHISKELKEIQDNPEDFQEWIDVIILAMDGFWRHGGSPGRLMQMLRHKQSKNFARRWLVPTNEDVAVEHDRSGEGRRER
jgi:hypothetical protein